MTHTPGPWNNSGGYITADDGTEIADVEWAGSEPEGKANARLIAAAPELLSQLKMAADFISGHNECLSEPAGSGDREWNDYCIGLLEACKSAIAKAEGSAE